MNGGIPLLLEHETRELIGGGLFNQLLLGFM